MYHCIEHIFCTNIGCVIFLSHGFLLEGGNHLPVTCGNQQGTPSPTKQEKGEPVIACLGAGICDHFIPVRSVEFMQSCVQKHSDGIYVLLFI